MTIIDAKTNKILDLEIIFSFVCPQTKRKYIALDFKKNIFHKNSFYNNLDLLEIVKEDSNTIYISEIEDDQWENVKQTLQYQIFSKK